MTLRFCPIFLDMRALRLPAFTYIKAVLNSRISSIRS